MSMSRECHDFNVSNSGKKVNIFRVYDVKSIEKAFSSMGKVFGIYDRIGEKLDERYEVEYGITVQTMLIVCVVGWWKIKREVQIIEYNGYAYRVEEILKYVPDSIIASFPPRADAAKEYVSKYYNMDGVHRLEANPEPCTEKFFKKEEETW